MTDKPNTSSSNKLTNHASRLLKRDKLNVIVSHYIATTYGNMIVAFACIFVLQDFISPLELWSWLAAIALFSAIYIVLRNRYSQPEQQNPDDVNKWAIIFTCTAIMSGAPWAYAAWFFIIESQPHYMTFMVVILMGLAAGAIGSNGGYFPAFLGYAVPLMVVLSVRVYLVDSPVSDVLSFLVISLMGGFISFAHATQHALETSLKLQYKNAQLLNQLEENNDELSIQIELAREANRQKSLFLANASHDLRQPLQSLTLFSEVLNFQTQDAQAQDTIVKMDQSIAALNSLLNALLDISQLDAGDIIPKHQHIDLNLLFSQLQQSFAATAKEQQIELTASDNLPFITSDPHLLKRCI